MKVEFHTISVLVPILQHNRIRPLASADVNWLNKQNFPWLTSSIRFKEFSRM